MRKQRLLPDEIVQGLANLVPNSQEEIRGRRSGQDFRKHPYLPETCPIDKPVRILNSHEVESTTMSFNETGEPVCCSGRAIGIVVLGLLQGV